MMTVAASAFVGTVAIVVIVMLAWSVVRSVRRADRYVDRHTHALDVDPTLPSMTTLGALAFEIGLDATVEVHGRMAGDANKIVVTVHAAPSAADARVGEAT